MRIIEHFKKELPPDNTRLYCFALLRKVVSRSITMTILAGIVIFVCLNLLACSSIQLSKKPGHNLIKTPAPVENKVDQGSAKLDKPFSLSGLWKLGYRYQGKTAIASVQIRQNYQQFSGSGKDEENGATFKIVSGSINGNEIIFVKKYDKNPNQPIHYHGRFSYLPNENGGTPYMGGDFSLELNGAVMAGEWEAAPSDSIAATQSANVDNNQSQNDQSAPLAGNSSEHVPDLSGKWNIAYEYNFKIIHSTMFVEQYGNKLTGHGFDTENKEKFIIKKGWYTFPHITIVRQYINGSQRGRTLTFKADVSQVSDKDYTGPYLSGKTQGGGAWEGERID